jgi:signal peptidase I
MESTDIGVAAVQASATAQLPAPATSEASKSTFAEYIESLLVTILLALFGTTFIVQAFKIPSQSMEPTLLVGDHLMVNKFLFEGRGAWYEKLLPYRPIHRGDIIVFRFPYDDHPHYVKRVIGLPRDRIRIAGQQVYVNGNHLTESYVIHEPSAEDAFGGNFPPASQHFFDGGLRPEWAEQIMKYVQHGELVVPANHYFVMGDNRERSWDSRYWGFVDQDSIMGRPMIVYWSIDATSEDYANRSFTGTIRGIADTLLHLPYRTRWHRMLREVH